MSYNFAFALRQDRSKFASMSLSRCSGDFEIFFALSGLALSNPKGLKMGLSQIIICALSSPPSAVGYNFTRPEYKASELARGLMTFFIVNFDGIMSPISSIRGQPTLQIPSRALHKLRALTLRSFYSLRSCGGSGSAVSIRSPTPPSPRPVAPFPCFARLTAQLLNSATYNEYERIKCNPTPPRPSPEGEGSAGSLINWGLTIHYSRVKI